MYRALTAPLRNSHLPLRTLRASSTGTSTSPTTASDTQTSNSQNRSNTTSENTGEVKHETIKKSRPTIAEQDEALKAKMAGLSGEGGEAGVEYENGEPVAMKRSVRNNMFRYI